MKEPLIYYILFMIATFIASFGLMIAIDTANIIGIISMSIGVCFVSYIWYLVECTRKNAGEVI